MEKDTTQVKLYEHFLRFFLPEGILDYFELVWAETKSLDSRESKKDVLYTGTLHLYLDERDNRSAEQQALRPNGFTEETIISDFPVRDKKLTLHIRRRRWLSAEGKSIILNIYPLVADGTRYSAEFAASLFIILALSPFLPAYTRG